MEDFIPSPETFLEFFLARVSGRNYSFNVAASGEAEPNNLISVLDRTFFRGTNPINVAEDFSG